MTTDEIKSLVEKYEDKKYFVNDPVSFLWQLTDKKDIEIMGILCSWVAYGSRKLIYEKCQELYDVMGGKPYQYIMSGDWHSLEGRDTNNFYRFFSYADLIAVLDRLCGLYIKYEDLEGAVNDSMKGNNKPLLDGLILLFNDIKGFPKDSKSCVKRLNLFLRWMIRDGNIDMGNWKSFDKKDLIMPCDVHVLKQSRELGWLTRKSNDMKAAIELTNKCKEYCPEDPTKLDFFLFGYSYEKTHPREFEEPKKEEYKATTLDLMLSATYLILWLNDCATNLIKELEYDANLRDKETRKIYGALKRRKNEYQREINSIVGANKSEFFAFFNEEMDNTFEPLVSAVKDEVLKAYEENGIEDAEYLSLVETARFMTEYSCKVNSKCVKDLLRITEKAVSLRSYRLTELYKVMEDFTNWSYRKCSNLNLNMNGVVLDRFHDLDNAIGNIQNTLTAIEKANKLIGE